MPHTWTIKLLELTAIYSKTISLTKKTMSYWKTNTCLYTERKLTETEDTEIQCGIFHGALLPPLLFPVGLRQLVWRADVTTSMCQMLQTLAASTS